MKDPIRDPKKKGPQWFPAESEGNRELFLMTRELLREHQNIPLNFDDYQYVFGTKVYQDVCRWQLHVSNVIGSFTPAKARIKGRDC